MLCIRYMYYLHNQLPILVESACTQLLNHILKNVFFRIDDHHMVTPSLILQRRAPTQSARSAELLLGVPKIFNPCHHIIHGQ